MARASVAVAGCVRTMQPLVRCASFLRVFARLAKRGVDARRTIPSAAIIRPLPARLLKRQEECGRSNPTPPDAAPPPALRGSGLARQVIHSRQRPAGVLHELIERRGHVAAM